MIAKRQAALRKRREKELARRVAADHENAEILLVAVRELGTIMRDYMDQNHDFHVLVANEFGWETS